MSGGVDPSPPFDPALDAPRAAVQRAEQLIGIRRYTEALPWLGRAAAAEPESARAHCLMALALMGLGQFRRALEAAGRAAAADPHDEWPQRIRTVALLAAGRRREALRAAREAVRLGPNVPAALFMLVQAQLACGRMREADRAAVRLAEVAPGEALTFQALAHVAMCRKDWAPAEAHLRRALSLDSESYDAMNDLGLVLHERGRAREALDQLHDAVRVNPARSEAHENLQVVLRRFLQPRWIVPAGIAAGMAARAVPGADASLPLALALVMAAYLWWRRRRLQTLPAPMLALSKLEREWWRQRGPLETTRLLAVFTVLLWAVAFASAAMNGYRYGARDWALLVASPVTMTGALGALWLRAGREGGGRPSG